MAASLETTNGSTASSTAEPLDQKIKLQSGDKQIFIVDLAVAKMSKVVKQMIDDLTVDEKPTDWSTVEAIPLQNVSGPILRKIISWMEYHHKTDIPGADKAEVELSHFTDDISDWDEEFLKVDQGTLFELILATNFLNIRPLRTVCCKAVARDLKKKTVEQIRETYNIPNDFTPEEEEALRKENEWCEDHQDAPEAE